MISQLLFAAVVVFVALVVLGAAASIVFAAWWFLVGRRITQRLDAERAAAVERIEKRRGIICDGIRTPPSRRLALDREDRRS